jgi:hypothetical protein
MIPLSTLRARIQRLEAARPSPERRFIVVAGLEEDLDRDAIARLPGQAMTLLTGVPHAKLRPPTLWEEAADGRWLVTDPQDLAA